MTEKKKPKKRKSMTARLKEANNEIKRLTDVVDRIHDDKWKMKRELVKLKLILPKHYYKISCRVKCNEGGVISSDDLIAGYSPDDAIDTFVTTLTHPDTFKLIDIKKVT